MACILDAFSFHAFEPECELRQLTPHGWCSELEHFELDLLFIESAWQGKDDLWTEGRITKQGSELTAIVEWCRARSIPTVFWNKEDPVHFSTFLNTSALFDYVFTTDLDSIHRYRSSLGHDRVYLLPYAVQPKSFNPLEIEPRIDAFSFAGSHCGRYPERARDFHNMVEELIKMHPLLIWDRNYGPDDPRCSFPLEYRPFILGSLPFEEVQHAYKGYRYTINLNSIKQSQTMLAGHVFELLASNSIVVSNFARSLRVLLGELVIASDSAEEIAHRVSALDKNLSRSRKLRLSGLRKVMQSHTSRHRLNYIWSQVTDSATATASPEVLVVSPARTQEEADAAVSNFRRQLYDMKRLLIIPEGDFEKVSGLAGPDITIHDQSKPLAFGSDIQPDFVAGMVPRDYYGPNYLIDLALGTSYSDAPALGKASFFQSDKGSDPQLLNNGLQYKPFRELATRRSIVRSDVLDGLSAVEWARALPAGRVPTELGVALDEFNYCEDGTASAAATNPIVDDLELLDIGIELDELNALVSRIPRGVDGRDTRYDISADQIYSWFRGQNEAWCSLMVRGSALYVESTLAGDKFGYIWGEELNADNLLTRNPQDMLVDVAPGLDIRLVLRFLDGKGERLGSEVIAANTKQELVWPRETREVQPGLRIAGRGAAILNGVILDHLELEPPTIVSRGSHLVVTNHYPTYDDLYRNAFVHRRVLSYKRRGVSADVFRLKRGKALAFCEFESVDVITGSKRALRRIVEQGEHESVMVHFLDEEMWEVLKPFANDLRIVIFIHGVEIQPWHRRSFQFTGEEEIRSAMAASKRRVAFWQRVLAELPATAHLVFVSQYLADAVMDDLGVTIPQHSYSVIHNPIDTALFDHLPKPASQRFKILSIRPFTWKTYANDLSVQAILRLTEEPWFDDLDIRLVGQGRLFEEVVAPLRGMPNVTLEQRFLRQTEIASLHKEYGIFLCPTRMDSHGVSRDEAMASGLVPVTTDTAAVPEFVDESCGILAPEENFEELSNGIARLVESPDLFQQMSHAAARRVRSQSSAERVTDQELALVTDVTDLPSSV